MSYINPARTFCVLLCLLHSTFSSADTAMQREANSRFALSSGLHNENENLDAIVRQEFGKRAIVADWDTLKRALNDSDKVQAFCDALGISSGESVLLYRGGTGGWEGSIRHYFATRNDHVLPGNYLAHDTIDDHFIDLGSWYDLSQHILVDRSPPPQYLDITGIPDVNDDGVDDEAILVLINYAEPKYFLRLVDGATGKQLKHVLVGKKKRIAATAVASVGSEISILVTKLASGTNVLQLRDASTLELTRVIRLP